MVSRLGYAIGVTFMVGSLSGCSLDSPAYGQGQKTSSSEANQDIVGPDLKLLRFPAAMSTSSSAHFEFTSTDSAAHFECSLNQQAYAPCSSPLTLLNLTDGEYQMSIRAVDPAGNLSAEGLLKWLVNRTSLTVNLQTMIPQFTPSRSASIAFNGSAPGSFECRIDLLDYAPCTSPIQLSNLLEGDHAVQIRLRDAAGNQSVPATLTWRVDSSAPIIVINSGPSGTVAFNGFGTLDVTYMFVAQDNSSGLKSLTCQLDNGPEVNCENSIKYVNVSYENNHTFTIKATDYAGNVSSESRSFTLQSPPIANPGG